VINRNNDELDGTRFNLNDDYEYRNNSYISQTTSKKPPRKLFSGSIAANSIGIKNGNKSNRIANASSAKSNKSSNIDKNKTSVS
jgi:hypothetical protein